MQFRRCLFHSNHQEYLRDLHLKKWYKNLNFKEEKDRRTYHGTNMEKVSQDEGIKFNSQGAERFKGTRY